VVGVTTIKPVGPLVIVVVVWTGEAIGLLTISPHVLVEAPRTGRRVLVCAKGREFVVNHCPMASRVRLTALFGARLILVDDAAFGAVPDSGRFAVGVE
jgi:hypothetical protein